MEKTYHFRVAEVFEDWDKDFLDSYGIEKVGSVFLFDREEETYIAGIQPSYFGRFVYYNVYTDFEPDTYEWSLAHDAVMREPGKDDYFSHIPEGDSFPAPLV